MISKSRINELIELFNASDNADFELEEFGNRGLLKRDLVEAKVQTDRWGVCLNKWVFHSSMEQLVKALFEKENKANNENFCIWGADVIFTDNIEPDIAIGMCVNNDDGTLRINDSKKLSNSVVVFNIT
jgi:hypothetical protein